MKNDKRSPRLKRTGFGKNPEGLSSRSSRDTYFWGCSRVPDAQSLRQMRQDMFSRGRWRLKASIPARAPSSLAKAAATA